jgi:hypothetical protein
MLINILTNAGVWNMAGTRPSFCPHVPATVNPLDIELSFGIVVQRRDTKLQAGPAPTLTLRL